MDNNRDALINLGSCPITGVDKPSSTIKPSRQRPADERPTDKRPADERQADERPANE